MISYEILRRKRTPTPSAPPAPDEGGLFARIGRKIQQNPESPRMHPMAMGKLPYTKWLTEMVYPKFPRGTLVTIVSQPFVPGIAPRVWFKVIEHQELHYSAQYDKETGQPKCVGVSLESLAHHPNGTIPVYYPPAALRVLQPEEIEAIDRLRNQEGGGRDAQDARLDGTEESVDRSTGETS